MSTSNGHTAQRWSVYREVNERIVAASDAHWGLVHALELMCECAADGCTGMVRTTHADFDLARQHALSLVLPGHGERCARTLERAGCWLVARPSTTPRRFTRQRFPDASA